MQVPVKISAIVEAMDLQSDEISAYLNRRTGAIVIISDEEFRAVEEGKPLEKYPEWQRESIETAREILEDKEEVYVRLPTQFEIHEWEIMDRFAWQVDDEQVSEELQYALRGRGAFRMFKDAIHRLGVAEEWYEFKKQALKQIAVEWCEEKGIPFVEE
ncbi:hypothetical protein D6779_00535 [Candidatus Parcubacteria bacterium]|nr:MAG: hypothetical protein D6779_00535 [Candidatus Parcubacteria bacterium]